MMTQSFAELSPRIRPLSAFPRRVVESAEPTVDAVVAGLEDVVAVLAADFSGAEHATNTAARTMVWVESKSVRVRRDRW
jgi:hypothetical protein